jgi:hypothetical protein
VQICVDLQSIDIAQQGGAGGALDFAEMCGWSSDSPTTASA